MSRRNALTQLAALPFMVAAGTSIAAETKAPLKIMMKSAWGSDDPTKAAFPFLHGHALAEAGHEVQIFLLDEAVSLMRRSVAKAVLPGRAAFRGCNSSASGSGQTYISDRITPFARELPY